MKEQCRNCHFCVDIVEASETQPVAMGWCYGLPPAYAGQNQASDVPVPVDKRFCSLFRLRDKPTTPTPTRNVKLKAKRS